MATEPWRLISLRAPVYIFGSFKKPEVDVDRKVVALNATGQ